jgi:hypothetical protein
MLPLPLQLLDPTLTIDLQLFGVDYSTVGSLGFFVSEEFLGRVSHAMRTASSRYGLNSLLIFTLIPVIVAAIYALRLAYRYFFKRNFDAPNILFLQLCATHGLNREERKILRKAANNWQIGDPSLLFIDQSLWKIDAKARDISPINLKQSDRELFKLVSLHSRLMRETA